ncbi:hypothetical protein CR203_07255 [Salipaludibacillus neizhouensis]|uniref:MobA-like NTP transferase domain-containing protein n=1 Tax=Salipaludibacillus neizhouensis TaxID=885475 RepID=A0A3A9KCP2_9BACI|nr:nucleotidyltransferase family protein [Salipaludibacillus neizhouensis]RKL68271.1 hypothetical protein CR203_07255 [Salipaludibacillus neizhouensis]
MLKKKKSSVCAVILAAGTGSRMENATPKQLLPLKGQYILERVIHQVQKHPFEQIILVVGHEADALKRKTKIDSARVQWLTNEDYLRGQSTSFLTGLRNVRPSISSAMVFLGDQPFILDTTIAAIFKHGASKSEREAAGFVIQPCFKEVPGHPVYWGNIQTLSLSDISGDRGGLQQMKTVRKEAMEVKDPFISFDIDTPEDFTSAKKMAHYLT